MIPFNKPHMTGNELSYIEDAVSEGKISGNGKYTKKTQQFFKEEFGFKNCLLTTSCTDALEMAAILLDIQPGDQVIMPSYTFVSTANAFELRGAEIIFADSRQDHPGIDESSIESLITEKTKAIVVVHYAGVACDMDSIMSIADKHDIFVVEDAAQAIDNYYIDSRGRMRVLGSIGHLATFSFHETKNIISGEGGMLVVNDQRFVERAEIIWEKGTNRAAFFRGEIDKYGWVDLGSSFLPSELTSAFLYAQLTHLKEIQNKRISIWNTYYKELKAYSARSGIGLPAVPSYSMNNAHIFYLVCKSAAQRDALIKHLRHNGIHAVFHYQSLHRSEYFKDKHDGRELKQSDRFSDCLLRLPLYYELNDAQQEHIIDCVKSFRKEQRLLPMHKRTAASFLSTGTES